MRPKKISVSPDAADRNGIGAAQTTGAARELLINGALSSGFDRNGVCQAQTPSGSGALTINGAFADGDAAVFSNASRVLIYSDGDDSGVTFTVTGKNLYGAKIIETIAGPNATYAFGSKSFKKITSVEISAAGTGNIEVGAQGIASMDIPRHVSIYSSGDISGVDFTVTGKDRYGTEVSETITGPNATTVTGSINFDTITKVSADGAVGTNVEIGSADEFETQFISLDRYRDNHAMQLILSSDKNYTIDVQLTADDLQVAYNTGEESEIDIVEDSGLQNITADTLKNVSGVVSGTRCQVTSFVAGSFEFTAYSARG